jgi:hypothetical protein
MTKEIILKQKQDRLNKLIQNGKNFDSAGVVRKLKREIRNLSSDKN